MTHFLRRSAILFGAAALAAMPLTAQAKPSSAGINLNTLAYYSSEWVFTNAFDQAASWWPQRVSSSIWNTGAWLDLDANGWVKSLQWDQAAGTLLFRDIDGRYPGGRYVLTYQGDGDLQIGFDAQVVSRAPGRIEFDVTPSDLGIYIKLMRTNPSDYLRDIRVTQKAHEFRQSRFHPALIAQVLPYRVLRFMDFQRTNDSPVQNWGERITDTHYTQDSPYGVSLEVMVDLCNEVDVEPWLCVPHQADDSYVWNMATLVRDRLDPNLRVWIEYSNEVWNSLYSQAGYASQNGIWSGFSNDPIEAQHRYYAHRSGEVHRIFEQVFGGTSRMQRVLSSQNANPWVARTILDWNQAYQRADVLAIAPYFGAALGHPNMTSTVLSSRIEDILLYCYYDIPLTLAQTRQNVAEATQRGLRTVAYEGGQHLVGHSGAQHNQALADKFIAANRHPWMYLLTRYHLDMWRQTGGTLFTYYSSTGVPTKWGSWGSREYMDQDPLSAPKMLALLDYLTRNPKWW